MPERTDVNLSSRRGARDLDVCTVSCSSEILTASEYVFSYDRMRKNCHRLRIGAIRSRKPKESGGST